MNLDILSSLSILLPLIIGVIFFRKILISSKILTVYVLSTTIIEMLSLYFYLNQWNNHFLFHLHTYFEFTAYSIILRRLIRSIVVKRFIKGVIPVFILFSVMNSLLWEDITGFNSFQRHIEGTLIIGYCLFYVFEHQYYDSFSLTEHPYLIFAFALLIYFSGSLFLFIFSRSMFATPEYSDWVIHGYLNIFLNLIFAIVIGRSIVFPSERR